MFSWYVFIIYKNCTIPLSCIVQNQEKIVLFLFGIPPLIPCFFSNHPPFFVPTVPTVPTSVYIYIIIIIKYIYMRQLRRDGSGGIAGFPVGMAFQPVPTVPTGRKILVLKMPIKWPDIRIVENGRIKNQSNFDNDSHHHRRV